MTVDLSWCSSCGCDLSVAHVVAEIPCPSCGERLYFCAVCDTSREDKQAEAERLMRLGRWEDAGEICAAHGGLDTFAQRHACAVDAAELYDAVTMPLKTLKKALQGVHSAPVVKWVLTEYHGLGPLF